MNKNILAIATKIYRKYTFLQPFLAFVYHKFFLKPTFSGRGIQTYHELPWNDEYEWSIFRKASEDVKHFEFTKNASGLDSSNIDTCLWRHWIVAYAVQHAIEFAETNEFNFVECGVADGITAFFTLKEIGSEKNIAERFSMHLYDSWSTMAKEGLHESEFSSVGAYVNLNVNITKKNLAEFNDKIVYHVGYIPESFSTLPESPNSIVYLSIDLNSANATLSVLNFFFKRLVRGGVILFDDYGTLGHSETKKIIDEFLHNKPGLLMKLVTGQAIYYR